MIIVDDLNSNLIKILKYCNFTVHTKTQNRLKYKLLSTTKSDPPVLRRHRYTELLQILTILI